jgi:hypothetical protein
MLCMTFWDVPALEVLFMRTPRLIQILTVLLPHLAFGALSTDQPLAPDSLRSACHPPASNRLMDFSRKFRQISPVKSFWPGFDLAQAGVIVISSDSSSTCSYTPNSASTELTELRQPLNIDQRPYAFCGGSRLLKCSDYLDDLSYGVLLDLSSGDRIAKQFRIDSNTLQLNEIVHEAFHLFGQELEPAKSNWPTQFVGVDFNTRKEIKEKCYRSSAAVESLVEKERLALFAAMETAKGSGRRVELKTRLMEFLAARDQRYRLLEDVRLQDGALTCASAESAIEMVEGAPDYVAYKTLFESGLMQASEMLKIDDQLLRANVPGDFGHYYVAGAIELFVIDELEGGVKGFLSRAQKEARLTLTEEIRHLTAQSQTWESAK